MLLGRKGQLGRELERTLAPLGVVWATDVDQLDLLDTAALRTAIRSQKPQLIVNAAAYTAVDRAESEAEKAHAINATVPGILAEEARALGSTLIHYSTDYVFDGRKGSPYLETDAPNPLNVYGSSKLAGEQAIQAAGCSYLILRTAWVYSLGAESFVSKVLRWARQNEILHIVDDQISNPTWARMLAEVTAQLVGRGVDHLRQRNGLYHLAGSGYASRWEWAKHILELDPQKQEQTVKEILPAPTSDFPTSAERPLFSALDCSRFGAAFDGITLPEWKDALVLALS
jgi:dTDP-4-dehydrorhamnose reductase